MMSFFRRKPELSRAELFDLVRDPMLTEQLRLAKERGELGVLSRQTRDINIQAAPMEALEAALLECGCWHATYPETDDWELVSWLEARIQEEIMRRSLWKITGGDAGPFARALPPITDDQQARLSVWLKDNIDPDDLPAKS